MPKRQAIQIKRDRRAVSELYLKGMIQAEIGEQLGMTQIMVSRDLRAVQDQWLKDATGDLGERKAQELAKIDELERTYWEAWIKSQEDAQTIRREISPGDGDSAAMDKETTTTTGQTGDPRFLNGVERCIDKRCKILGIDAPTEINLANKPGQVLKVEDVGFTNEARIARMLELFDAARARRTGSADLGDKPTLAD